MRKKGDAIGRFEFALSYLEGADKSVVWAIEWMKKAFDVIDSQEETDMIKKRFDEVRGKEPKFDSAFQERIGQKERIKMLLEQADALYESDKAKAFELYKQVAEQGHAWAQCQIGCMYDHGEGVEEDMPAWAQS